MQLAWCQASSGHRVCLEELQSSKPPQSGVRQPAVSPRGVPEGAAAVSVLRGVQQDGASQGALLGKLFRCPGLAGEAAGVLSTLVLGHAAVRCWCFQCRGRALQR